MQLESANLDAVDQLIKRGLYLQAHARIPQTMPLSEWRDPVGTPLAVRLLRALGAERTASQLELLGWRWFPNSANAYYQHARGLQDRMGDWRALRFLHRHPIPPQASPMDQADVWLLQAGIHARSQDVATALDCHSRAAAMVPNYAWLIGMESYIWLLQDEPERALQLSRTALERHPDLPMGYHYTADILMQLNAQDEALAVLQQARARFESSAIIRQMVRVYEVMRRPQAAYELLHELDTYIPLADKSALEQLYHWRYHMAYQMGDLPTAVQWAGQCKNKYCQQFVTAYQNPAHRVRRVELAVPYVRQDESTCAPASITSVCRYWNIAADHDAIVQAICYDGTADFKQREWARQQGLYVREFTLDWASAQTLLDREIPVMVSTRETTSGHAQVLVGYDVLRETLLFRDPSRDFICEYDQAEFFTRYAAYGPRALVVLPQAQAGRLEGVELPDATLRDLLHRIQLALDAHQRESAGQLLDELVGSAPDHVLTLHGRLHVAGYDEAAPSLGSLLQQWHSRYPTNASVLLRLARHYHTAGDLKGAYELLARHGQGAKQDVDLRILFVRVMRDYQTDPATAYRYAQRLDRRAGRKSELYSCMAQLCWELRQYPESLQLYRLAACSQTREEQGFSTYFEACHQLNQAEPALELLRQRVRRLLPKSPDPSGTLALALDSMGRFDEAEKVLSEALQQHPTQGGFRLQAADLVMRYGQLERAQTWLQEAQAQSSAALYHRASARLARMRGDVPAAIEHWQKSLEYNPLSLRAYEGLTRCLTEHEGPDAAQAYLRGVVVTYPDHYEIRCLYLRTIPENQLDDREAGVREHLRRYPNDTWALRELTELLIHREQWELAQTSLLQAQVLQPYGYSNQNLEGMLYRQQGRVAEARAAFRRAYELYPGNQYAIYQLTQLPGTTDEFKADLEFIFTHLRGHNDGEQTLSTYFDFASEHYSDAHIMTQLESLQHTCPNWAMVTALRIALHLRMDQKNIALDLAQDAVKKWPHHYRLWTDLADVQRALADRAAEEVSLRRAIELAPLETYPLRALYDIYFSRGAFQDCLELMQQALRRDPMRARNYYCQALAYWMLEQRSDAIASMQKALHLDPGEITWWDSLESWGNQADQPGLAKQLARTLTTQMPGVVDGWKALARLSHAAEDAQEYQQAWTAWRRLAPLDWRAFDDQAVMLTTRREFSEAVAACQASGYPAVLPYTLRGRAIWVLAQADNHKQAIADMGELLREYPDFQWGWTQLAEWAEHVRNIPIQMQAATNLVRLAPHDTVALNYLGTAYELQNMREQAIATYQRALRLDAGNVYAAIRMARLYEKKLAYAQSRETLAAIEQHIYRDEYLAHMVLASVDQPGQQLVLLEELLTSPRVNDHVYTMALESVFAGRSMKAAMELVIRLLQQDKTTVATTPFLIKLLLKHHSRLVEDLLNQFSARPEVYRAALLAWVEGAGERGLDQQFLRLLPRHRTELYDHMPLWGLVGWALIALGYRHKCIEWLETGDIRPGTEAWMLHNLALAYLETCDYDSMVRVSRQALSLPRDIIYDQQIVMLHLGELPSDEARCRPVLRQQCDQPHEDDMRQYLDLIKPWLDWSDRPVPESSWVTVKVLFRMYRMLAKYGRNQTRRPMLKRNYLIARASLLRRDNRWPVRLVAMALLVG